MKDPREDYILLDDIARNYFGHEKKTMEKWIGNRFKKNCVEKYPFPIFRFGRQKSSWYVRKIDLKQYMDMVIKDTVTEYELCESSV